MSDGGRKERVYVTTGKDRHCGACQSGIITDPVEALVLVDGVPYYAHGSTDLNEVIHLLRLVLDDHGVPEFTFVLTLGRAPFGVS